MVVTKKKTGDTWKKKQWYDVLAPEAFDSKEIGQIVATEESSLLNRIIEVPLSDITGNRGQAYTKLSFRIIDVAGKTAKTKLVGHEVSRDYLRTLVRRRKSIIDAVFDSQTKDGFAVRVKLRGFVATKIGMDKKAEVRRAMVDACIKKVTSTNYNELEKDIIFGNVSRDMFAAIKKIIPTKKVEIRKVELVENIAAKTKT